MNNIDTLYKSYLEKCKEMKIKPGTKRSVFGYLIDQEKIKDENRVSIEELSKAKKAPAPKLSETAIKAKSVTTKLRVLRSIKPKPVKDLKVKKEAALKIEKPKRVKLTHEELIERNRKSAREYQAKKRLEKGVSPRQSPDETKRKRNEYQREYYAKNKKKSLDRNREYAQSNKDKVSEYNRKQRDKKKDWTPQQWEEHRAKAREYRKQNAEKIRAQDRARGPKKRERFKQNIAAVERRLEKERNRYQQIKDDPDRIEKLRAKWRRDGERKRLKSIIGNGIGNA
ncbi:MAG: hypothetical protein V2A75_07815 [Pseudomonadota bacterium]